MKKFVLLQSIFFLSLCAVPLFSQDLDSTLPNSTMTFEETTYDFGTIESGEEVTHVFTFTNTGEEPLILSNAKGSCGCTVPQWPQDPILPGEIASITVRFNSKGKFGRQSKRVTITANTEPANTYLNIKGHVLESPAEEESEAVTVAPATVNPDCFAIFPNPTAEMLNLDVEERFSGKAAIISIHAKDGQLMAQKEIESLQGIVEMNVSHYPAGTYMASVQVDGQPAETHCFVVVD